MEKGSQLSKIKQEKKDLERTVMNDNLVTIQKEKEKNAQDLSTRIEPIDKSQSQKIQNQHDDKIYKLEKEKKEIEQELRNMSLNETKLKKEIANLESKTEKNNIKEARLMKDISELEDKVRYKTHNLKMKDLNQKYRLNLESCIQKILKLSEKSQFDQLSLKMLKSHIDQIISHMNSSLHDTKMLNVFYFCLYLGLKIIFTYGIATA